MFSNHPTRSMLLLASLLAMTIVLPSHVADGEPPEPWISAPENPFYFALRVEDVDRAASWYEAALGLEKLNDMSAEDDAWRIVNMEGEHLFVELIRDSRATSANRALGIAKVGFAVADVEQVADNAERATGERPRIIDDERHGIRIVQLRDPEGNIIQLSSPLKK